MRSGSAAILATLAVLGALSLPAPAAERTWSGPVNGVWGTAGNWMPSGTPAATDALSVLSGTPKASGAPVRISSGGSVLMQGVGVSALFTVSTASYDYSFSTGYTGVGTLTIQDGATLTCNRGSHAGAVEIGNLADANGLVTVQGTGAKWTITAVSWLDVGNAGIGRLVVGPGGTVAASASYLGYAGTARGTATVSGAGATWTNTSELVVGKNGTGTLNVKEGGTVSALKLYVGQFATGSGTMSVDGVNSSLTTTGGGAIVGSSGDGTLRITGGGLLASVGGYIGDLAGSDGAVEVVGPGARWNNSSELDVGYYGRGALTIRDGATASNAKGVLGYYSPAVGSVTVSGSGSRWTNTGELDVGYEAQGSVTIRDGATASSATAYVGYKATGNGTVLVSGSGAKWTASSSPVYVAHTGQGTVRIEGGAKIESTVVNIGHVKNAVGSVEVDGRADDGTASWWSASSDVNVGRAGSGSLTVNSGGKVSGADGYIAADAGGSGGAIVDGAGSTWATTAEFSVAHLGVGTLIVRNGGLVSDWTGHVGFAADANGVATVDGAGSRWTHGSDLDVGRTGDGTMTISAGGRVSNSNAYVGYNATGYGKVVVDGASSTWVTNHMLRVGYRGKGTMTVRSGGQVTSENAEVASDTTASRGDVIVDGAGSLWAVNGGVTLGMDGAATLTVRSGGSVTDGSSVLGYTTGARGDATVDGADSLWDNTGSLMIGRQGIGTLTVRNGGAVASGSGYLGTDVGGDGTAVVDGHDSIWSVDGTISVGDWSVGRLTVRGGGQVASGSATLGRGTGANGLAIVQDTGSTWINYGSMYLGGGGDAAGGPGELDVQGGQVQVGGTMKLWPGGVVRVSGGSLWAYKLVRDPAATVELTGGRLSFATFQGDLVNAGGDVSPGLVCGPATIEGNYTQSAGRLVIELGDAHYTAQAPTYDRLTVQGQAHLDGSLLLEWLPVAGDPACRFGGIYDVLVYPAGGLDGGFSVDPGQLAAYYNGVATVDAGGGNLALRVALGDLIDGDVDLDGRVGRGDLLAIQAGFGKVGATWLDGDLNFDQSVDWLDYLVLKSLYSDAAPPFQSPESAALALLGLGGAVLVLRRKRRALTASKLAR